MKEYCITYNLFDVEEDLILKKNAVHMIRANTSDSAEWSFFKMFEQRYPHNHFYMKIVSVCVCDDQHIEY